MITEILPEDVLIESRKALGLQVYNADILIDETYIAALLRHCAGIFCPCSRATLRTVILECLQYLAREVSLLPDNVDAAIEGLIIGGDLLELSNVTNDDPSVKGTWVFAAPPRYIVRPGGSFFLTGIVPDQDMFLPRFLSSRIMYEGLTRVITPESEEDLAHELRELGLQELSEGSWLKCPKVGTAENMQDSMLDLLSSELMNGIVEDLIILDPTKSVTYYSGRWVSVKKQSGTFVAKRPQEYGAPVWCFVELENGLVTKLLDFPLIKIRWRGCDVAWHLQMAIDHCRNTPQVYKRHYVDGGVCFDFFSPLPQWSERRLMILGAPAVREKCLISYVVPITEAEVEEQFLHEQLWLVRMQCSD